MEPFDQRTEIHPADYFSPDARQPEQGFIRDNYLPVISTGVGVGMVMFANAFNRKPVFSGLQMHALFGSLGALFGIWGEKYVQRKAAQRDNILYHYILNHPEDFPPIQRKKYAEVLNRWVPIR